MLRSKIRNIGLLFCVPLVLTYCSLSCAAERDWGKVEAELVELLQALLRADTQNPPGNELAACKILDNFFDREGIQSRIYKVEKKRANLLARLHGNGSQKAIILAAHTDVVPVNAEEWSVPPFSGQFEDGFIYGRGALDDKGMLAVNAVVLALLKHNNVPLRRDVIFLATAGEETGGGIGAGWMLERHRDKLNAAFALSEGGRIIFKDGEPLYIALQTEEKIAYNIKLTVQGTSGHASIPRLDNAIYSLAQALDRVARFPVRIVLDPVTRAFFKGVALRDHRVEMIDGLPRTAHPIYLALLTNTISPTLIEGGVKTNVHPQEAVVNLNCRLLPNQNVNAFVDSLYVWIGPGPYQLRYKPKPPAPIPSPQDGIGFVLIEQVCGEMFPGVPVLPYLSPGMSDATRFRKAGIPTYGLIPFPLEEDEVWRIHGKDERISLEALMTGLKLVYRLAVLAGS